MNCSCSWCIAAPSTKALAGRCFLFCSRMHTQILPCDRLFFIYFTRKFLYGSYLKQIWQHSNEQFSPQTHPSYVSFSSTEIFQHCQAFVKHGQNLCHLFFILARQRCAEVKGLPHHSIPPGDSWQYLHFPRNIHGQGDRTRLFSALAAHAEASFVSFGCAFTTFLLNSRLS